jgi:anti-anti-sigma factor
VQRESTAGDVFRVRILTDDDLAENHLVEDDRTVVLALEGECDLASAPLLDAVLRESDRGGSVVLDVEELTFLDCAALTVLLDAAERCRGAGAQLTLRGARPFVRRVVALAGATEHLGLGEGSAVT